MNGPFKDEKTNLLYEDIKEAAKFAESLKLYTIAAILTYLQSAMVNDGKSVAHLQEQADALGKVGKKYCPLDR
jgi:hypothetical protein